MSRFFFVNNQTLRENLDTVFNQIIGAVVLSESVAQDSDKELELQIFYKYCVNSTASIVEALLYHYLQRFFSINSLPSKSFKYKNPKVYTVDGLEIAISTREKEIIQLPQVPFEQIIRYYEEEWYLNTDAIEKLDALRKQRNKMHLQWLVDIHKCSKEDVDLAFSTAKIVVKLGEKLHADLHNSTWRS